MLARKTNPYSSTTAVIIRKIRVERITKQENKHNESKSLPLGGYGMTIDGLLK